MIMAAGAGLFTIGQFTTPGRFINPIHTTVQASTNEQRLTNRVDRFAATRKSYRYSQIGWNSRDLGGYETANHKYMVKPDRLIRGNNLHNIRQTGVNKMHQLNVKKIIDLRDHTEIAKNPDPDERGYKGPNRLRIPIKHYAIMTDRGKASTYRAKHYYGEIYHYGAPFVTYRVAINNYRNVFHAALNNKRGALFYHCIVGRDRTGTVSALLLKSLGVSNYTIYNDFLLTNYYNHKYSYTYQCQEMNRFFGTINSHYGSMNNYIRNVIGINNRQIHQLRKMYLVRIR